MPTDRRLPGWVYDLAGQGYQVEETHISWVFLGPEGAFKVKKPVDFGYLDFSAPWKRRFACEREVELNSRLTPEAYRGVIPVTLDPEGRHRLGGPGAPVDWAVHMVRYPANQRGDRRLEAGTLSIDHLEALAGRLAGFHAAWPPDARAAAFGRPEAVRANVEENFTQGREAMRLVLGSEAAGRLERGLVGYLADHEQVFRRRIEAGRVRDGHGDLRLSQIYFDDAGKSSILDCIEFNDRFRFGDVCSDAAFLAMDLSVRGRPDLAENFLAAYARESGDYDLYALVDFYESYRACVRGKIAGYGIMENGADAAARQASEQKARAHFQFALNRLERAREKPPLIAFCGGMGTGKSTLATALGRQLGASVLDSDRLRKRLAGLDPLARRSEGLWKGIYDAASTAKVYAELRDQARTILESGRTAILDASFRSFSQRESLRELARDLDRECLWFECRADDRLVAERLRQREQRPAVSDGRQEISRDFLAAWEPLEEREGAHVIETDKPPEACLSRILESIVLGGEAVVLWKQ